MIFNYALNKKDYTISNALLWGNCLAHCQKASQGALGSRLVHVIITCLEALPIIGQIASLIEYLIVQAFSKKEGFSPPFRSRTNNLNFSQES